MEDGLHQSTVQICPRIDGWNYHARRIRQGTESGVANYRGVELRAAIRIRMDTKDRLPHAPGDDGRFECARRRFDMYSPTRAVRPMPLSQQPEEPPEVSTSTGLWAFCS